MSVTVYGIPNCDSVRRARAMLTASAVEHTFHDFKKLGVPEAELRAWVATHGWETLLNRAGTTWRNLDADVKTAVTDAESAVDVMLAHPSTIKRPVIRQNEKTIVGLDTVAINSLA